MDLKKIGVVILNWNGKKFLEQYLPNIIQHTNTDIAQLYIIDNASTDDSESFIAATYPQISWIQNDENYGFAKGYHVGLTSIREEILCLLNSDIEVTPHWLDKIYEKFTLHPEIAAIQPKILDLKQPNKFEYAGGSGGYIDRFGYAVCRGRYFEEIEEDLGQYDDEVPIFWASGCCIFVRNQVYWQVGGLDEHYFAHQEEIDLCWRIQNYGHQVIVMPDIVVYHLGGGTLNYGSMFKVFLNFRNSLFTLFKNLKTYQLLFILPIRLALDGVAAMHSLIKIKNLSVLLAIFRAHMSFYAHLGKLLEKRNSVKFKGYPKTVTKKLILLDYYIFRVKTYRQLEPNKFIP
jgi:hypothetical protein